MSLAFAALTFPPSVSFKTPPQRASCLVKQLEGPSQKIKSSDLKGGRLRATLNLTHDFGPYGIYARIFNYGKIHKVVAI